MINSLLTNNIYSTSEQRIGTWINGKPVYRKVIYMGAMPNNSYVEKSTGLDHSKIKLTKLTGVGYFEAAPASGQVAIGDIYSRFQLRNSGIIRLTTTIDYTGYVAYAIIEYIKTTD